VMEQCIERGCRADGVLPGGLQVRRRAGPLFRTLQVRPATGDPLAALDWVSLFALAVNEENAAGGRVVTAPTNGAAGVIPAVLAYHRRFLGGAAESTRDFLLTAAAVGSLYKRNASLSAAEMGCQGEVGVACSMAAAGLAAVMGGTNEQVENAAEIGMEHNLGLTCDPIGGLVQVPCIERNTMGAAKAINAARLAVLHGDGTHRVPLDKVIETMRQTGLDMQDKYKETSKGGLALNVVNC
jgi:L-serine dehydratase